MRRPVIALIRGYQRFVSPWLGEHCRFYPTCSSYAVEALEQHGFFSGMWLAVRRLLKCHPFHPGGLDPVPPVKSERRARGTRPSTLPASGGWNMSTGGRSSATPQFSRL